MAVTSGRERTTPRRDGSVILVTVCLPASAQPVNSAMVPAIRSAVRPYPDIALVHELNLPVDYFPAIFVMSIRCTVVRSLIQLSHCAFARNRRSASMSTVPATQEDTPL